MNKKVNSSKHPRGYFPGSAPLLPARALADTTHYTTQSKSRYKQTTTHWEAGVRTRGHTPMGIQHQHFGVQISPTPTHNTTTRTTHHSRAGRDHARLRLILRCHPPQPTGSDSRDGDGSFGTPPPPPTPLAPSMHPGAQCRPHPPQSPTERRAGRRGPRHLWAPPRPPPPPRTLRRR